MASVMTEEGDLPGVEQPEPRTRILTDWSIDRLIARLDGWFGKFRAHMEQWTDERPPPDLEKDQRDLRDLVLAAVEAGAQRARIEISSQHTEGGGDGGNGDKSWREKLLFPLLVAILAAAILGAASNWVKLAVLENEIHEHVRTEELQRMEQKQDADRRFDRLERKVFP